MSPYFHLISRDTRLSKLGVIHRQVNVLKYFSKAQMRRLTSWYKVVSVVAFLSTVLVANAQTSSSPVPLPAPGGDTGAPSKGVATAPISKAAGAPVDSTKYKIGPADVINVQVWHEPEFSGLMAVHEDGKFTMPLVGELDAGGKTPADVQDEVSAALKKYVVNPLVQVSVQDVGSKRYYMDGLINRPGEYPLVVPTTILEAISKAGGVNDFANKKHIYVLRGDKRIYFNYNDVIKGKHMDQNILLQNGDHVFIPG